MMKKISRVAVLTAVLAATAGVEAQAETPSVTDSDAATTTVRVLNNYRSAVRIFLQDSDGNLYRLGRVASLGLQTFEVPNDLVDKGDDVELIAIPVKLPLGFTVPAATYPGVETATISLEPGQMIDFWLEPDLASSTASIEL